MRYDTLLYAGLYSLSVIYQSFTIRNPQNRSTAVSEKLVFRVGKKAMVDGQALPDKVTSWLLPCKTLETLNRDVLGCVG
jgi:hypothetical protein